MIGIIAAMQVELDLIKSELKKCKEEAHGGITFYKGEYKGKKTVAAVCGIGKVYAAMCAEAMILEYSPDIIINTGVAGSLSDGLHILDCTVADKCVQHDMDTSPLGDPVGMISGINKVYFESDEKGSALLCDCYRSLGVEPVYCTVASGDVFVASADKKKYIKDTFGASVCEMESAAIAHVCYVNGTPFVISRAISDGADGDAQIDFPVMCKTAAERSSKAVLEFIKRYGE
jgi:adenosylhomocysteine nucleosidase